MGAGLEAVVDVGDDPRRVGHVDVQLALQFAQFGRLEAQNGEPDDETGVRDRRRRDAVDRGFGPQVFALLQFVVLAD